MNSKWKDSIPIPGDHSSILDVVNYESTSYSVVSEHILNIIKREDDRSVVNSEPNETSFGEKEHDKLKKANYFGELSNEVLRNDNLINGKIDINKKIMYRENKNFVSRKEYLNDIFSTFENKTNNSRIQILRGIAGIGKTQIAVKYTYEYSNLYDSIWWLRAEDKLVLLSDYCKIISKSSRFEENSQIINFEDTLSYVKEKIENSKFKILLIFDNANSLEDIMDYLPNSDNVDIIITSQSALWRNIGKIHKIEPLDIDNSIKFLTKKTSKTNSNDLNDLKNLAKLLDGLPLALEQAGAYIDDTGCSVKDYIGLFEINKMQLISEGKPQDYKFTLATTWEIAFKKIEEESLTSINLLNKIAFLDADEIQECILLFEDSKFNFNKDISILRKFSLIERREEKISTHRLLQIIVQEKILDEDKKYIIEKLFKNIYVLLGSLDELQQVDYKVLDCYINFWSQIRKLYVYAKKLKIYDEIISVLLLKVGNYLYSIGNYNEAEYYTRESLLVIQHCENTESFVLGDINAQLGEICRKLSKLYVAKDAFESAISIYKEYYQHDNEKIITLINELALISHELADYDKAKEYYLKLANLVKGKENNYSSEFMAVYNSSFSMTLTELEEFKEAEEKIKKAIEIDNKLGVKGKQFLIRDLNNFGYLYEKQRNFIKAQEYYIQTLEQYNRFYGEMLHPDIIEIYINIGNILRFLKEYVKSINYYQQGLDTAKKFYNNESANIAIIYHNIGNVYCDLEEYELAENNLKQSLEIDKNIYPENHPEIAKDLIGLGILYIRMNGDIKKSIFYLESALEITFKSHNVDNETCIFICMHLMLLYLNAGNYKKAKDNWDKFVQAKKYYCMKNQEYDDVERIYSKIFSY